MDHQWIIVSFIVVLAIIIAMGSVAYLKLSHIERETVKMQTDTLQRSKIKLTAPSGH